MQWRKVMTADYNKFNLIIDFEYKMLPKHEYVHDHEGNLLYFYTYNPADVPVYDSNAERIIDEDWLTKLHESKQPFGIRWNICEPGHINYSMPGTDCGGVPTFSHCTQDYFADYYFATFNEFEPLTVDTVVKWFGWFLYQLNNSYLQIK